MAIEVEKLSHLKVAALQTLERPVLSVIGDGQVGIHGTPHAAHPEIKIIQKVKLGHNQTTVVPHRADVCWMI